PTLPPRRRRWSTRRQPTSASVRDSFERVPLIGAPPKSTPRPGLLFPWGRRTSSLSRIFWSKTPTEERADDENAEGSICVGEGSRRNDGGSQIHGLHWTVAALHGAAGRAERGLLRGRAGLRRLVHPRLDGDPCFRHAGDAGRHHRGDGSVHE